MSVIRQFNWTSQQRVDIPHLRTLDSSVAGDFDVTVGRWATGGRPVVVRGFAMTNSAGAANALQMATADGIVANLQASTSGSFLWVPADRSIETLNPDNNSRIVGTWTPNQTNYVGLDFKRAADVTTADLVQFLDPNTNLETPRQIPLARVLDYVVVISTLPFAAQPNLVPVAKVAVDSNGNITSCVDARPMLFRLGTGGDAPDIQHSYPWPDGRKEGVLTNDTGFIGGDKAITDQKSWMDAVMTRLWELGGGEYWYGTAADRNVQLTWTADGGFGTGDNFDWNLGTQTLQWKNLRVIFSDSTGTYNDILDGTAVLLAGQCLYVDLDRTSNTTKTATIADITTLGAGDPPGSRTILAWRSGNLIFSKGGKFPVGTVVVPATVGSNGVVRLNATPASSSTPTVVTIQANGTASVTATSGNTNGFTGTASGTGDGLYGVSGAIGVHGYSSGSLGVYGESDGGSGVLGEHTGGVAGQAGLYGKNISSIGFGVIGESLAGTGVRGFSTTGVGVRGESASEDGVYGSSSVSGVHGYSDGLHGVWGESDGTNGVYGEHTGGVAGQAGVRGVNVSSNGYGVLGISLDGVGVAGTSTNNFGVSAISTNSSAITAASSNAGYTVDVVNLNPSGTGIHAFAVRGAYFEGLNRAIEALSYTSYAILGIGAAGFAGIRGVGGTAGAGVSGLGTTIGAGVTGTGGASSGTGIIGNGGGPSGIGGVFSGAGAGTGLTATSPSGIGLTATSNNAATWAILATQTDSSGYAIKATGPSGIESVSGTGTAGRFENNSGIAATVSAVNTGAYYGLYATGKTGILAATANASGYAVEMTSSAAGWAAQVTNTNSLGGGVRVTMSTQNRPGVNLDGGCIRLDNSDYDTFGTLDNNKCVGQRNIIKAKCRFHHAPFPGYADLTAKYNVATAIATAYGGGGSYVTVTFTQEVPADAAFDVTGIFVAGVTPANGNYFMVTPHIGGGGGVDYITVRAFPQTSPGVEATTPDFSLIVS